MPSENLSHWLLDPSVTFLNHGSFGACPKKVLDHQSELRAELEGEPVRFMMTLGERMTAARQALGAFVGAHHDDLAFVPNATSGINTVLRSLEFAAGDQIVITDHSYNACRNAAAWVAARSGAELRVARVPFPLEEPSQVTRAVLAAVTDSTKLVVIDHVTSPTGLIFPLAEIVSALDDLGIDTLVDGAHAPGMVPLDLSALGASYYTGNLHKWTCAPKGAAFLHVQADHQDQMAPLTISHGLNDPDPDRPRFRRLFDWVGTIDPTPFLAVPRAIDVVGSMHPEGWPGVMDSNRTLALAARDVLVDALDIPPPAPDPMIGSMVSLPLDWAGGDWAGGDWAGGAVAQHQEYLPLAHTLWDRGFEVPVYGWPDTSSALIRISAQRYNDLDDYRRLAQILAELRP